MQLPPFVNTHGPVRIMCASQLLIASSIHIRMYVWNILVVLVFIFDI